MVFRSKVTKSINQDSELILSTDFYLHKTIMQAIESPFKSLENNSFKEGLRAVQLSGFLAEKLAQSAMVFTEDEEKELKEYIFSEREKLISEGIEKDSETLKSMLSYSKICWILKQVEGNKASKTEYKV